MLVGHGSRRRPGQGSAVAAHAAALARRGLFRDVAACFLKGYPGLEETRAALTAPRLYVVPFFMSDGYATGTLIPRALGLPGPGTPKIAGPPGGPAAGPAGAPASGLSVPGPGGLSVPGPVPALLYCTPVGLAPGLAALLARRVDETCRRHGLSPGDVSVLLVGHGTLKDPASAAAARRHAARLAAQGRFARVSAAFLDEPPYLVKAAARLARPAVVVGLFAEAGLHGGDDVPRLLGLGSRKPGQGSPGERDTGEEATGEGGAGAVIGPEAVIYAGPIGPDPGMADLVLDRVRAFDAGHGSGGDGR